VKTKIKYVKSKVNNPRLFFTARGSCEGGPAVGTLFFHLSRITNVMWTALKVRVVRLVCGMKSDFLPYSSDFNCGAFYIFFLSPLLLTTTTLSSRVTFYSFTFMLPCIVIDFFLINQPDALIIQIYSVIKLYMFRASSLPIIRSFLLYIRHW